MAPVFRSLMTTMVSSQSNQMTAGLVQFILALPISLRQKNLAKVRPPMNETEFVAEVIKMGGDEEAALLIHRELCDWVCAKGFTPYPDDNLLRIYGMADEELDEDLILDMLERFGLPIPDQELIDDFGAMDTPTDVARLIKVMRTHSMTADKAVRPGHSLS